MYFYCLMFKRRVTLKKLLATTLSTSLLGMSLSCVAVCAERIENSAAVNAYVLNKSCAGEGGPMMACVISMLPERFFLLPESEDSVIRRPPVFRAELISGRSQRRFCFPSSLAPPFERLRVLRI